MQNNENYVPKKIVQIECNNYVNNKAYMASLTVDGCVLTCVISLSLLYASKSVIARSSGMSRDFHPFV